MYLKNIKHYAYLICIFVLLYFSMLVIFYYFKYRFTPLPAEHTSSVVGKYDFHQIQYIFSRQAIGYNLLVWTQQISTSCLTRLTQLDENNI